MDPNGTPISQFYANNRFRAVMSSGPWIEEASPDAPQRAAPVLYRRANTEAIKAGQRAVLLSGGQFYRGIHDGKHGTVLRVADGMATLDFIDVPRGSHYGVLFIDVPVEHVFPI